MGYNLSSVREGFNALKTGFRRCIMQITIAIKWRVVALRNVV
ncbi:hypothetical protein T4A_718 [Trichinella pseudospiralis]|uniref:Uncharacterized protein n=1 Tax=Trichinella pseudospiralis TaxID=6337 RepID=A0A0V1DP34_TRIPS|nr:hypothetical protein T4A_5751 [Trichinella pseudospiralis]KRY63096.1 hypothetical protein T4A_718 [Trichinella pseudospiralis]KRY98647.1 hypothetical protein T4C_4410 [Trichinella pseudospiralis]